MSAEIASKLPRVGTTIFTVMSQLAQDCNAINLSQGFPDFAAPEALLDAVERHMRAGRNQYAPMTGVPALREAVAGKIADCYGRTVDPASEVTVTSGATEALLCAITAVIHPGDEAIVFDPCYDSYDPAVSLCGGRTVHVPLSPGSFLPDWDRVRDAISERTRLIIINTPHNPTGSVWSREDILTLADLVETHGLYVVSDEVYEHIVFDGIEHESVLRHPRLAARSFAISSFGKTYHATGWKIGYCVAPPALSVEFRKIHQYVTFATVTPMQHALADFLSDHPEHHRDLSAFYQRKRDLFCSLIGDSRLRAVPSAGTYFQLADYSAISDEPDTVFSQRMTRETGVATIPVSVFYETEPAGQRLIRFCFAKDDMTLERAAELLRTL